jgi:hypothetical protein
VQKLESLQATKYSFVFFLMLCMHSNLGAAVAPSMQEVVKYDPQSFRLCCYITVDFATAASQNSVFITQQKCHIMILFDDYSMTKGK